MAEPFDTLGVAIADVIQRLADGVITEAQAGEELSPLLAGVNDGEFGARVEDIIGVMGRITGLLMVEAAPSNLLGTPGSYAWDRLNKVFYGPKDAVTGWPPGDAMTEGPPGPSIQLQVTATHIQWRVVGTSTWTNLIALSSLKGADGKEVSLQKSATHVQWRLGAGAWADLIPLADLKGATGDTGPKGDTGDAAWSPIFATVADGERRVLQVSDWAGGEGTKPATGAYLGEIGFVATAAEATDVRGAAGDGAGDMLAANNLSDVADDAAARNNLDVWSKGEADGRYQRGTAVSATGDVAANIAAMEAAKGFVRFGEGQVTLAANATISSAVFEGGGSIWVAEGVTLTINEAINAPRQQIFYGPGQILLNEEASHLVLPEWFGAFPNRPALNAAPALQKISDSVLAGRQCLVQFGVGTYYIQSPVSWSRACKVLGAGHRLTHFRTGMTTGDVFSCAGEGVHFDNIQFSCTSLRTTGAYVNLSSQHCAATHVWATDGFECVAINAGQCRAERITGSAWSNAANSCLVSRKAGDDADIVDVQSLGTGSTAPQRVVHVRPSSGAMRYGKVENVRGAGGGTALVEMHADAFDLEYIDVSKVSVKGGSGDGVVFRSGTGNMRSCGMDSIKANTVGGTGVVVTKTGAGAMTAITIGQHDLRATGDGMRIEAASGQVQGVSIGAGFARNCGGHGYNLKAVGLAAAGIQARSNTGTGVLVQTGSATYYIQGTAEFNGTNVSHPAEANSVCTVVAP